MNQNISEKLGRFINLLEGIFELDKADLDFGIYRIMNIRKDEIKQFLSDGLPKKVQEALAPFAADTGTIKKRIAEIEKQCDDVGIEVSKSKMADEYACLKSQLASGTDLSSLETDVYSALYGFFNRYYDEGDFISKRRYKEGVYAIPYEGEEVKLYWANADQYYIKTAENFRDYTFIDGGKKVHFRTVDATTEKNNNKESDTNKREFMLYTETPEKPELKTIEEIDGELVIRFVYDVPTDKKVKWAEVNLATISDVIAKQFKGWYHLLAPASGAKKETRTILEKHLTAYVAKNTFDYFIHKDLRGFLTRELDFFIKSEVIHLDDIDTTDEKRADSYLAKVRAVKRVGKVIIDFLAQIEDFQKKLWLKKKFVVATNWCVTLDRVDEAFYPEIIANAAQISEWKEMYAIDEIKGDLVTIGYSEQLTADFLRQNGNLVLDTRHFTADFKDRLIAGIDNLDEQTGGLLIHSENSQALRLMAGKYREQIKCVYIDPPYNTNASPIMYKNGYKDSSWISLISDRIALADTLLPTGTISTTAIDHAELYNLGKFLDDFYDAENRIAIVTVQHNPKGRNQAEFFSENTEYLLFYAKDIHQAAFNDVAIDDDVKDTFAEQDDSGKFRWEPYIRARTSWSRKNRPDNWYPIYVSKDLTVITSDYHADYYELYPITNTGEFSWKNIKSSFDKLNKNNYFNAVNEDGKIVLYHQYRENQVLKNLWIDKKYQSEFNGTNLLKDMFDKTGLFTYPKSVYAVGDVIKLASPTSGIVLDYFAGSGTTGHAVLNVNREDNGCRKYILVEMGEYFHTVTLPRMKKVIYSADWKSGKPENRNTGVSHIMKYVVLESYEDALSNIELSDEAHSLFALMGEDYMLRYMFNYEAKDSMLSLDAFAAPFTYMLKINENNETKHKIVDLCETMNFLLGLSVIRQSTVAYFCAVPDDKGEYEGAVKLERNDSGEYGFKQIEGRTPDGKRALIIWRTVTKDLLKSNAALDAYFTKHRINPADREFDVIYVNGDNNLENLRLDDESWKVQRIEPLFKEKMFEEAE